MSSTLSAGIDPRSVGMMTGGQVETALRQAHGVSHKHAQLILSAGLLGRPFRTPGGRWYTGERVRALCERAQVDEREALAALGREPVFVARVNARKQVHEPDREWIGFDGAAFDVPLSEREHQLAQDQQLEAIRGWYLVSAETEREIRDRIARTGFQAFVATVGGAVVACYQMGEHVTRLQGYLAFSPTDQPIGPWANAFDQHFLRTGPGAVWSWYHPANPYKRP